MRLPAAPSSLLSRVRIFDRVLTAQSSAALAGEDEGTYYRTPSSSRERAIEAVLGGLGESAAQIEHWGREYWHPIDVHRDVDEAAARGGAVRSPRSVCLLFLEVAAALRAPSLVWLGNGGGEGADAAAGADDSLLIVPAVSGRLLSFPGHMLHGVPRPAHAWLSSGGGGGGSDGSSGGGSSGGGSDGSGSSGGSSGRSGAGQLRRVRILNCWDDGAPTTAGGGAARPSRGAARPAARPAGSAASRSAPQRGWRAVAVGTPAPAHAHADEGEGGAAAAGGVSSLVAPLMRGASSDDDDGISSHLASLVDAPADELQVACNPI